MNILGISAFYHDSASALVRDGAVIAAAVSVKDIEYFVFYDKPLLKFERLLETYLALTPRGFCSFAKALPVWAHEKLFQDRILRDELSRYMPGVDFEKRLLYTEHHQSHAASAFCPSPYDSAAILTMDGVGEWTTTSIGFGEGSDLKIHREILFPPIGDVEFDENEPVFASHSPGTRLDRLSTEIEMLLSGGVDSGLYIMIGRKV